ncbi:hypothetical protein [Legionella shakespearei]|uniref:Coiled coil domain-containing protein n=1 Tax=Legionella shakespearei DSM 23087 TaxID=1122169 RepID=A0A0W0Z7B1_9GAMM|nr:hypothetical protein [Legionella shakespearei]KTD65015.1 coiled coil domain-containing protein [Legionella shakespearei DSM 23087]
MPFYNDIPLIGKYLRSQALLNSISPEKQKALEAEYREAIGLGDNVSFGSGAFNALDAARISDYHGFENTKGPGGASLFKKFNANDDAAKAVRAGIAQALETTPEYQKAKAEYAESAATFKELVKKVPGTFSAQALITTMQENRDEARAAIVTQQTHEKESLEEQFKNKDFIGHLMTTLDIPGNPEDAEAKKSVELVKNALMKDLSESHKKQLQEFDKSTSDALSKLHGSSAEENKQIAFIAHLARLDDTNRKQIEAIAEEMRKKKGIENPEHRTGVDVNFDEDKTRITGIKISDLPHFKTLTGKTIVQNPPGTFSIEMPRIDPLYYQDPRQKPLADMSQIAMAVKASGYDTITMNVNFKGELGMERGRQAYEACINQGFDPDKIIIKVNGKEMKPDELFKEHAETYQKLHGKASQLAADRKADKQPENAPGDTAVVRAAMAKQREINAAKTEVPEEPKSGPQATL